MTLYTDDISQCKDIVWMKEGQKTIHPFNPCCITSEKCVDIGMKFSRNFFGVKLGIQSVSQENDPNNKKGQRFDKSPLFQSKRVSQCFFSLTVSLPIKKSFCFEPLQKLELGITKLIIEVACNILHPDSKSNSENLGAGGKTGSLKNFARQI